MDIARVDELDRFRRRKGSVVKVQVSDEVNRIVEKSIALSVNNGQFFIGVEHVFNVLLQEADQLPDCIQQDYMELLFQVAGEMNRRCWSGPARGGTGEIFHTPRAINALQAANKLAMIII